MRTTSDTPVLIAGAGPVGLALAVELSLRGVECLVVEPRPRPTRLRPRAKTLNTRTMEHARRWGLAQRLRAAAPLPVSWSQDVSFCTSFLGAEITRFTGVLGLGDDGHSPERGQQMPQYVLEEVLREVAAELPTVDLRLGWRLRDLDATGDGPVQATVEDPAGNPVTVTAQYAVGADGARSVVREQIGARYAGTTALRPNTGVVFRSAELVRAAPHPPAVQTWLLNRQAPGMMGPVDRDGLWWLIAFGVDGRAAGFDASRLISGALGRELADVEVISTDPWTARMELADRARRGRVFLIGDAAHLNPPFGGHGLNTGIGDAVDLGWKLAASLAGWGGPGLLDSYEAERRPLHRRVIDEAATNMATLAPELLGDGLGHRYADSPVLPPSPPEPGPWASRAVPGRRLPHVWVSPGVSTLDLVTGSHLILTADGALGARAGRAAAAAGLPVTVTQLEPPLMRRLGAALIIVRPDQVVHLTDDATLTALARHGVTTALDMGSESAELVASQRGRPGVTDLRSSGASATSPASAHARRMGRARGLVADPGEAKGYVARSAAEGADYIKVIIDLPGFDEPTVLALVEAAHGHGLRTIAHAATRDAVLLAQAAGVDVLTHAPLDRLLDDGDVRRTRAAEQVAVPTLTMMEAIVERVGAHAPASPPYGTSLHHELGLLVDAGLSPVDALRSATVLAARYWGLADRGVIAAGQRADLLLVDGDPLTDISAVSQVTAVWCAGAPVAGVPNQTKEN
jgi:2-polyprenyl-6-methoxyphenol hydroxylase-like FAD-dependent oxidoreductase/imidazolonepropionase-like amidohydrolase